MEDRDIIYYPVHLTPGYEAAIKSSENQSEVRKHCVLNILSMYFHCSMVFNQEILPTMFDKPSCF